MSRSSRTLVTPVTVAALAGVAACSLSVSDPPSGSAASTPVSCEVADAKQLALGQVVAPVTESGICLGGGDAGSEFALVLFNGSGVATSVAAVNVQTTGVGSVAPPPLSDAFAESRIAISRTPSNSRNAAFDAQLRAMERNELTSRIAGARRFRAARARGDVPALNDVIPAQVRLGQVLRLNANAWVPCTSPDFRFGRVVSITKKAIVVADTANPPGGYTDQDYHDIAISFDTLVDPLDTRNFGDPSDIDGNGHIVLFFTRAVNELTPPNSGWFIGGFFFARDLFPPTPSPDFGACPSSNYGEMFYLLVPDPNGVVNGNVFEKSTVTTLSVATVAHEYQHLINAARRMYVNTQATSFEEVWLNEGLSHEAEELLFFAESGLKPRDNTDATAILASPAITDAFNCYASNNFGRLLQFLVDPSSNSPFSPDDLLATRGATWSFLRYAVDQQSAAESNYWYKLANSTTTGLANLAQAFGAPLGPLFRDWATAMLADDVPGVGARYQQPSWNFRSIYDATGGNYPLGTISAGDGAVTTLGAEGGSAAYLRFTIASGQRGLVQWGTLPDVVQMTVVRTK